MKGGAARAGLSKSLKRDRASKARDTRKRRHAKGDRRRADQQQEAMAHLLALDAAQREAEIRRIEEQVQELHRQADELQAMAALTPAELAAARARADREAAGEFSNSDDSNSQSGGVGQGVEMELEYQLDHFDYLKRNLKAITAITNKLSYVLQGENDEFIKKYDLVDVIKKKGEIYRDLLSLEKMINENSFYKDMQSAKKASKISRLQSRAR